MKEETFDDREIYDALVDDPVHTTVNVCADTVTSETSMTGQGRSCTAMITSSSVDQLSAHQRI